MGSEMCIRDSFLGIGSDLGNKIGLSNDWAFNIITEVGNYKEIFERNFGSETKLGIARGLNSLWRDGGVLYAPPVR